MPYFLTRQPSTDDGTLGELSDNNGVHICYTIELPWLGNEPQTSCIPEGTYNVIPHNSPAHPNTWEITNVPNRSAILIHNGNTENDVKGCIAVGSEIGEINGLPAVLHSNSTLEMLQETLPPSFTLTIGVGNGTT